MTDRELDALVAEKVMGWKKNIPEIGHSWWSLSDNTFMRRVAWWSPTTRIEDAWKCVEALADRQVPGHVGPTRLHTLRFCGGAYEVNFCSDFGYTDTARDRSAGKAICLAALKALGVPTPGDTGQGEGRV